MVLLDNGDVFESNDLKGDACGRIFQAGLLQQTKSNLDSWRKGFHLQIFQAEAVAFRRAIAGASFFPAGCGVLVGVRLTRGRRTVIVGRLGRIGRMERVNIAPNLPLGANTVSR
uniref:Uncharacterized protein n=1 Tax=Triticum urartu TaxID=4572 RepID=A0A8R7Q6V9_TRIUA